MCAAWPLCRRSRFVHHIPAVAAVAVEGPGNPLAGSPTAFPLPPLSPRPWLRWHMTSTAPEVPIHTGVQRRWGPTCLDGSLVSGGFAPYGLWYGGTGPGPVRGTHKSCEEGTWGRRVERVWYLVFGIWCLVWEGFGGPVRGGGVCVCGWFWYGVVGEWQCLCVVFTCSGGGVWGGGGGRVVFAAWVVCGCAGHLFCAIVGSRVVPW